MFEKYTRGQSIPNHPSLGTPHDSKLDDLLKYARYKAMDPEFG